MRNNGNKLFVFALGIFVSLIVLEIALRVLGVASSYPARGVETFARDPAAFVVLCLGDSFTFGSGALDNNGYPPQLERLLRQEYPGKKIKVVNKGVGAFNTTMILERFDKNVEEVDPDLVIILAGGANAWNAYGYGDHLGRKDWSNRARDFLYNIKIFKLIQLFLYEDRNQKERILKNDPAFLPGEIKSIPPKASVNSFSERASPPGERVKRDCGMKEEALGEIAKSDPEKVGSMMRRASNEAEWRRKASNCEREGKNAEAISYYKKILEGNPQAYEAYEDLARVYFTMGNKEASRQSFKKSLEADPDRFQAYVLFAKRFMQDLERDDLVPDKEDLQFMQRYAYVNPIAGDVLKSVADKSKYRREIGNWIIHDIEEMIRRSRARGVDVILQDYPVYWDTCKSVNTLLREIAQKNSVTFVDNERIFEGLFLRGEHKDGYFAFDKAHCNEKGYGVMAQNIYNAIVKGAFIKSDPIIDHGK